MKFKFLLITFLFSVCTQAHAEWFLRGTQNSWGSTQMLAAGTNTMQLNNVVFSAAGSFKFDRYGDWKESYGVGGLNGTNISIAAGTWNITFFTNTKTWTVTLASSSSSAVASSSSLSSSSVISSSSSSSSSSKASSSSSVSSVQSSSAVSSIQSSSVASTSSSIASSSKSSSSSVVSSSVSSSSLNSSASSSLLSSSSSSASAAPIQIILKPTVTTAVGETVIVLGNQTVLSNWTTTAGLPCTTTAATTPVWTCQGFTLASGLSYQYKYAKRNASGVVTYESGSNRTRTAPTVTTIYSEAWGIVGGTVSFPSSSSSSSIKSSSSSSAVSVSSSVASSSSKSSSSSSAISSVISSTASSISSSSSGVKHAVLYYVHNDHQGTPQVVTNQAQQVVWMGDYQPFGKLQSGQTNSIELYSRFPGQYLDPETGLYYNYFRDYDPSIGRYIESDPIGLDGGINTYAYVKGNPISFIDPYGLFQFGQRGLGHILPSGPQTNGNDGIYHEHGFYQDGTGDNVGFFDSPNGGRVGKDPDYPENKDRYSLYPKVYDDARMRRAQNNVKSGKYNLGTNNCQDYADKLRDEYDRLLTEDFLTNYGSMLSMPSF